MNETSLAKRKFLARSGPDMRTLISIVLGISEVHMRDSSHPVHVMDAFARIYYSSKTLWDMLGNTIDIFNFEDDNLVLRVSKFQASQLLTEVSEIKSIDMLSKKLSLRIYVDESIPRGLVGDIARIKLILSSLLSIAFKTTLPGEVQMFANWQDKQRHSGDLIFVVEYTDEKPDSDNAMRQSTPTDAEDTQIHLLVAKNLAKSISATIDTRLISPNYQLVLRIPLDSYNEQPLGAGLARELSQSILRSTAASRPLAASMPDARVLIVDDVDTSRYIVKGLLGFYEMHIELAESGIQAISKVEAGAKYDIIFMDHLMPGMNGPEVTMKLRNMGYTLPIIALTAVTSQISVQDYLGFGFDGVLSKPVDTKELDAVVDRFVLSRLDDTTQPSRNLAKNMFTDFSNKGGLYQPDSMEKFRRDFAQKHKNSFADLAQAIDDSDHETAVWILSNIKNSAAIIAEPFLAKLCADAERAVIDDNVSPRLMDMLGLEIANTLQSIPPEDLQAEYDYDAKKADELLGRLYLLLSADNADSLFLVDELAKIPNTYSLVTHIENFDFPAALHALSDLRSKLEVQK